MKILLLGDASNYHFSLSKGLAMRGHDVTVASHGSRWMGTGRDIDLSRRPGKLGGAWLWLKLRTVLASQLKGYDVVHISNPVFVELMPHRVRRLFDHLRRHNGRVFLTLLGTDAPYVRMCCSPDSPLRYSEFAVAGHPTPYALANPRIKADWLGPMLTDHCNYIYEHIDGAVAALYEYYLSGATMLPTSRLAYGGIPIEMPAQAMARENGPLSVLWACHQGREAEKGADLMLPPLQKLAAELPHDVRLSIAQNLPIDEFRKCLAQADVVVDQLYAYSPSTTPLMAMAQGKIAVTGGEPEFYDFIGESDLRPIINPDPLHPEAFAQQLRLLALDPALRRKLGAQGREFVGKHNSLQVVAERYEQVWNR